MKVFNRLGLGRKIASIGGHMERVAYYSNTGEKLTDFSLQTLIAQVGRPYPAWEIASHGYRWIDYKYFDEETREHLLQAIAIHTRVTGSHPLGWYTGRTSPNTRRLVVSGCFLYDADSYADDLPYWVHDYSRSHLVIPYTLDNSDMRFATAQGFNSGDQFFAYLRDAFDVLYAEGETAPKIRWELYSPFFRGVGGSVAA